MVADIQELETMDATEIHPRRINAREVLTPQRGEEFLFPVADGTAKLSGKDHEFREPAQRQERLERSRPENLWPEIWSNIGKSRSEERKARMGERETRSSRTLEG